MLVWNWSTLKITIQVTGHFVKPKVVWCHMKKYPSCADGAVYTCVSLWVCLANGGLQSSIHLLLGQQRVPLGHRTPGIGQHVWPVAQPDARGAVADPALADGVVAAELVVVVHSDQHLDFLCAETAEEKELWSDQILLYESKFCCGSCMYFN